MTKLTRAEALKHITERLAAIEDARREAFWLLRGAAGVTAAALVAEPDVVLEEGVAERVEAWTARRALGEPLSRIEGRRGFYGLDLAISPHVLDPRADTETLVDAVLQDSAREAPLRVLDLGTGSGAILAAILSQRPQARGVGVDVSAQALATARANFDRLGLLSRVELRQGNWGEGVEGQFDIIVSNPPYIRTQDIASLAPEVRDHDPLCALDGGADGLDAYRALAPWLPKLLTPQGRAYLEIGAGQGEAIVTLMLSQGILLLRRLRDLAGFERGLVLCR